MLPGPNPVPSSLDEDWLALKDASSVSSMPGVQSTQPAIDDYLPSRGPLRARVLIELVHIDLELRLKAGESARIDEYLARYPELAADRAVILDLIAAEHDLRRRREPDLDRGGIFAAFPSVSRRSARTVRQRSSEDTPPGRATPAWTNRPNVRAMKSWACSAAAAWAWFTRPGSTASTGTSP